MRAKGHLVKIKKKKFGNISKQNNKTKIIDSKNLKKISFKFVKNPVELAIQEYNSKNKNKILCNTIKLEHMERITLNYIRHKLTNYDLIIKRLAAKRNNLYLGEFKESINKIIRKRYGKKFVEIELSLLIEEKFNATHNT